MKWSNLYIEGIGAFVPSLRENADEMVEIDRYDRVEHQKTGQIAAAVSSPALGESAPEMAVTAGRAALADARIDPSEIDVLIHAVVLHNGLEAWNCGSYIQSELDISDCIPIEIRTACAGGILGMEMIGKLCGDTRRGMVTASDAWRLPLFDRWSSDSGLVYGDGAGAVVLGRTGGPFRVLSTSVISDPVLERMHRGDETMDMPVYGARTPIDLKKRVAEFTRTRSIDEFWSRNSAALQKCADTALTDSGSNHDDITCWIVPNFGNVLLRKQCLEPLKIHPDQTLIEWGHTIGHTGAADPFIGLDHARSTTTLTPGDRLMMVGIGVGFTWGCAIVEYTGNERKEHRDEHKYAA